MSALLLETPVRDVREDTGEPPSSDASRNAGAVVTGLLVGGPLAGLAAFIAFGWGGPLTVWAVVVALGFYLLTGLGVTVGFHRLFAHHSFRAHRLLKVALAVTGSMAMEGSIIGWVAVHRRHHVFSDKPGDPHSPWGRGDGPLATAQGFLFAHVGWLFSGEPTDARRFAPELRRDRDLVIVDRLFPVWAVASLAAPFGIGCAITGNLAGGFAFFLWAGLVRMALLHHVTWSINSICHLWGRRPFEPGDRSTNVASLALVSFGESWHNFHHAAPASARHGVLARQFDLSAEVIRVLERAGWATNVRWPTSASIAAALAAPLAVAEV